MCQTFNIGAVNMPALWTGGIYDALCGCGVCTKCGALPVAVRARCRQNVERSAGAKKLSCRSTFTQPGRPKLSGNAGIVTPGERGKELGVSELQNGRARARKSARGTRAERRADGTGTHLKVFGQSKLDPHKAASPMLPSCIAPFSGQVPVMSRATRSSVSTTRRAINVPQPDLPGAAGELERGDEEDLCG